MRKGLRRKYHREAIKMMRYLNKVTEADARLNGRFIVIVNDEQWEYLNDKSGGLLTLTIRVYDRKFDEYKDYIWEFAPYFSTNEWELCMNILNDFACYQVEKHQELDFITPEKKKIDINEINRRPRRFYND